MKVGMDTIVLVLAVGSQLLAFASIVALVMVSRRGRSVALVHDDVNDASLNPTSPAATPAPPPDRIYAGPMDAEIQAQFNEMYRLKEMAELYDDEPEPRTVPNPNYVDSD